VKVKVVLEKVQKEIKKYANKRRGEVDDYKVEDLVMLSTKNLKYQMVRRRTVTINLISYRCSL